MLAILRSYKPNSTTFSILTITKVRTPQVKTTHWTAGLNADKTKRGILFCILHISMAQKTLLISSQSLFTLSFVFLWHFLAHIWNIHFKQSLCFFMSLHNDISIWASADLPNPRCIAKTQGKLWLWPSWELRLLWSPFWPQTLSCACAATGWDQNGSWWENRERQLQV